jgi:RNA polymerase sigma-32 factor
MAVTSDAERPSVIQRYFRDMRKHKLLSPEKTHQLVRRFQNHDDRDALNRLVKGNLRLVVRIAKGFWGGHHATLGDLIQEGNMGLIRAAEKYDPRKKVKFSYYASFWIKAYIQKYLMNNHRSVRLGTTQSQRKLYFNLGKISSRLRQEGIAPSDDRIAKRLNVPKKDVTEMRQRMARADSSLNAPLPNRDNGERIDHVPASSPSTEEKLEAFQLRKMVQTTARRFRGHLTERERDILERRILSEHPATLQKLGVRHGVSRERIRQVEGRIIDRFRSYLLDRLPDAERILYR